MAPASRRLAGLLPVLLLLPFAPTRAEGGAPGAAVPHVAHVPHVVVSSAELHELHETYADLAIEGAVVGGRLRFFKKELEGALGPVLGSDAVALVPGPAADALVLRYLRDRLTLVAGGDTLQPRILGAEEVRMGHHPGWEVTLAWEADAPIARLHVRSTLLFERHGDQRNVMRFLRLPEEARQTLTLEHGAAEGVVEAHPSTH